jgi:hypothetical protein
VSVTLNCILEEKGVEVWSGLMVGFCEHNNEHICSTEVITFVLS